MLSDGVPKNNVSDVSDLIVGLGCAIAEVAQFHGIDVEKTLQRNDDKNEIRITSPDLGRDCVRDLERCAELFNYHVVNEFGNDDKKDKEEDDENDGHNCGCC